MTKHHITVNHEKVQFCPQNFDNWPKVILLVWNCDFCQKGISPIHPGLPRKKILPEEMFQFQRRGHFLGQIPDFGHFGPFYFSR